MADSRRTLNNHHLHHGHLNTQVLPTPSHQSQISQRLNHHPLAQTLERPSRSPNTLLQKPSQELDMAREYVNRMKTLLREQKPTKDIIAKQLLGIVRMGQICAILKRQLGQEDKETLHAFYILAAALMVVYENDTELDQESWDVVKKEFYAVLEYTSKEKFYLPVSTPRSSSQGNGDFESESEDDDTIELDLSLDDVIDYVSSEKINQKWLNKTVEILGIAQKGYAKLWSAGKIAFDEKIRLSNIHDRLSTCAVMMDSPNRALKEAQHALEVLEDLKSPPPKALAAARLQVSVCKRLLAQYLLTDLVGDVKTCLSITIKLKVDSEAALKKSEAAGENNAARKLDLLREVENLRDTIIGQFDHLVDSLVDAGAESRREAIESARDYLDEQIFEHEEKAGLKTDWGFINAGPEVVIDEAYREPEFDTLISEEDSGAQDCVKVQEFLEDPVADKEVLHLIGIGQPGYWDRPENSRDAIAKKLCSLIA